MRRTVLITGGTSGIGAATAATFVNGADAVWITGRDPESGRAAERRLGLSGDVRWLQADVADARDCASVVDAVVEAHGRIDVLVNNAGTVGRRSPLLETEFDDVNEVLRTNVAGTIQMCVLVGRVMAEQRGGVIVNVGSTVAGLANHESIAYHASKGAVRSLTASAALQLAPYDVRVVEVSPGWVATDIVKRTLAADPEAEQLGRSLHMSNRIIEPGRVADAIHLLCSDEARVITGSTVFVDDGYASFKGAQFGA